MAHHCYRIMLGLFVFQIVMSGVLGLRFAYFEAAAVLPLLIATFWYAYNFRERFEPLTRFISLRSIKRGEDPGGNAIEDEDFGGEGERERERLRRGSTVDEDREKGLRFVNPSLVISLERPWIYEEPPPPEGEDEDGIADYRPGGSNRNGARSSDALGRQQSPADSTASSESLGDTHIWRDNWESNP